MKQLKLLFLSSMVILFTACGVGGGDSTILDGTTDIIPSEPTTPDATQWDKSNWDELKWQ